MSQQTKQSRKPGSNRIGTNLFGRGMRIITDEYRKGWDIAFGTGKKKKTVRSNRKRKG